MVATDLAEVATDPPEVRRRMDHLVARRMQRHETVVAALKETALRSTVRLSTGPPVTCINRTVHLCIMFFFSRKRALQYRLNISFTRTNTIEIILVKFQNGI